jgi:hypothetical protein
MIKNQGNILLQRHGMPCLNRTRHGVSLQFSINSEEAGYFLFIRLTKNLAAGLKNPDYILNLPSAICFRIRLRKTIIMIAAMLRPTQSTKAH